MPADLNGWKNSDSKFEPPKFEPPKFIKNGGNIILAVIAVIFVVLLLLINAFEIWVSLFSICSFDFIGSCFWDIEYFSFN